MHYSKSEHENRQGTERDAESPAGQAIAPAAEPARKSVIEQAFTGLSDALWKSSLEWQATAGSGNPPGPQSSDGNAEQTEPAEEAAQEPQLACKPTEEQEHVAEPPSAEKNAEQAAEPMDWPFLFTPSKEPKPAAEPEPVSEHLGRMTETPGDFPLPEAVVTPSTGSAEPSAEQTSAVATAEMQTLAMPELPVHPSVEILNATQPSPAMPEVEAIPESSGPSGEAPPSPGTGSAQQRPAGRGVWASVLLGLLGLAVIGAVVLFIRNSAVAPSPAKSEAGDTTEKRSGDAQPAKNEAVENPSASSAPAAASASESRNKEGKPAGGSPAGNDGGKNSSISNMPVTADLPKAVDGEGMRSAGDSVGGNDESGIPPVDNAQAAVDISTKAEETTQAPEPQVPTPDAHVGGRKARGAEARNPEGRVEVSRPPIGELAPFDYSLAPQYGTAADRRRAAEQLEKIRASRQQQNQSDNKP